MRLTFIQLSQGLFFYTSHNIRNYNVYIMIAYSVYKEKISALIGHAKYYIYIDILTVYSRNIGSLSNFSLIIEVEAGFYGYTIEKYGIV